MKKSKLSILTQLLFVSVALILFNSCQSESEKIDQTETPSNTELSATDKYEIAKKEYLSKPNDPDALIWFGRRTAYLGNFEEAIKIYTKGIELHPEDARMLRHRGHRYISTRQYDEAIADFEKAVILIKGKKDETETDGLPNSRNIPISTLHGNIWYHLGLAHYLKNDMDKALEAFSNRTVTEKYDDNLVSGGHWLYMILSRLGKNEEANAAIAKVNRDMDIIENSSYHYMCLFYKGELTEAELIPKDMQSSSDNVLSYGLGNWYLYQKQDSVKAKQYYEALLKTGNKYSFAYLAAEADYERIFATKN